MSKRGARYEAILEGEVRYDGRPCRNCGTTTKFTLSGACVECNRRKCAENRVVVMEARRAKGGYPC